MRTLRLSLVGTVMLVLCVAPAGVAQGDADMTEPAGVVITITDEEVGAEPKMSKPADVGYWLLDGAVFHSTWDATDPRLSGAATYTGTWHAYNDLPSSFAQLEAAAVTVTNDVGRWVGTGLGIASNDAELGSAAFGEVVWFHLQGEGAYEGMSAYLTMAVAHEDVARGLIFADELPPFPEPAE